MSEHDTPLVFIVDDDDAIRNSMAFLFLSVGLEAQAFGSAAEFLKGLPAADLLHPGVLVLDIRMPEMSGLELQRRLADHRFLLPIIIVTGHGDVPMAVEALRAGAFDFIEKPFKEQHLLDSVAAAIRLSRENLTGFAQQRRLEEKLNRLGRREQEVLDGLLAGKPNKVIAHELELSVKSIEVYRASVMSKMEANSLVELVKLMGLMGSSSGTPPFSSDVS